LIVNYLVIKPALFVVLGFLSFCSCLAAQQASRVERSKAETTALRELRFPRALDTPARLTLSRPEFSGAMHRSVFTEDLVMLTLFAGERSPASNESGGMGMPPLDYFQDGAEAQEVEPPRVDGKDSPSEVVTAPLSPLYYSGELGFFYGRSSGKFDREIMQTYFLGTVGNEKFQITVGAAYGESNVDVPRFHSGRSKH
jgi:hypothetical protein